MTIVCETCEVEVVLPARTVAAEDATDEFMAEHELHRVVMRLDFD